MRIKKHYELRPKTTVNHICQQFFFITQFFSDTCRHTKNKSWRRCRLYFRGRMQCQWIFDFEQDYHYNASNLLTIASKGYVCNQCNK
jgi:hypothetical protein